MEKDARIYVAGHRGLVGSALMRRLCELGYDRLVTRDREDLDLRDRRRVDDFFEAEQPDYVLLAAATVGGILANDSYPARFILDNLLIQTHVIDAAFRWRVKRLLFLGSSCIYPRGCPQPIREELLMTGELESTNRAYAVAKIAGLEMCRAYNRQHGTSFITLMPTNLYGPGDNFDLETSHVIPALLRKFHEAKESRADSVTLWGSGGPRREFLHVDDLADASIFLANHESAPEIINVGTGEDLSILELAGIIKETVGYEGVVEWDRAKPDGVQRKVLDVSRLRDLGWTHRVRLEEGLRKTYDWFLESIDRLTERRYPID